MITKDSTIFIVDYDKTYGIFIQCYLMKLGFKHISLFSDEKDCLDNMNQYPDVLISDYNLNFMSGLKLIQEARKISSGFYSVLLSGAFHKENYSNDMPSHYIDKCIVKGDNELQELSETLLLRILCIMNNFIND